MSDSMFDKLGDLLSEALESGIFFKEDSQSNSDTQQEVPNPLIKEIQPQIKELMEYFEIEPTFTYNQAKKQFHKKLKRFHPDSNSDNPIIKKITKEKTTEILRNWEELENWYTKN